MSLSSATTQTVTTASGTVAIATTSTSLGVAKVMQEAPIDAQHMIDVAQYVITTADKIGLFSASVMALSFAYNIYSTRKRQTLAKNRAELDARYYELRLDEHRLEKAKYKAGIE